MITVTLKDGTKLNADSFRKIYDKSGESSQIYTYITWTENSGFPHTIEELRDIFTDENTSKITVSNSTSERVIEGLKVHSISSNIDTWNNNISVCLKEDKVDTDDEA